jgi:CRP/FNR family transcriptional regulator, cyclic AMP receptor protein
VRLHQPGSGPGLPSDVLHWWATLAREGVDWLNETGGMRLLRRGTVVVHRGEPLNTMFIVLDGRLAVQRSGRSARGVDSVYPGEVLDDALSTGMPPSSVTLVADQDSCVFAMNKERLAVKLDDPAFAARFYRALGLLLAGSAERRMAQRRGGRRPAGAPSGEKPEPWRRRHGQGVRGDRVV